MVAGALGECPKGEEDEEEDHQIVEVPEEVPEGALGARLEGVPVHDVLEGAPAEEVRGEEDLEEVCVEAVPEEEGPVEGVPAEEGRVEGVPDEGDRVKGVPAEDHVEGVLDEGGHVEGVPAEEGHVEGAPDEGVPVEGAQAVAGLELVGLSGAASPEQQEDLEWGEEVFEVSQGREENPEGDLAEAVLPVVALAAGGTPEGPPASYVADCEGLLAVKAVHVEEA